LYLYFLVLFQTFECLGNTVDKRIYINNGIRLI
jgi:hypothetical protein